MSVNMDVGVSVVCGREVETDCGRNLEKEKL